MRKKRIAKATYEVGYGNPPKDKQFQKGKSGNPSGRRKKPASMPEVLQEELNQTITIRHNGKRQTTTKMQAAVAGLIIQSWDTANKASELSDYSACTTWGIVRTRDSIRVIPRSGRAPCFSPCQ